MLCAAHTHSHRLKDLTEQGERKSYFPQHQKEPVLLEALIPKEKRNKPVSNESSEQMKAEKYPLIFCFIFPSTLLLLSQLE